MPQLPISISKSFEFEDINNIKLFFENHMIVPRDKPNPQSCFAEKEAFRKGEATKLATHIRMPRNVKR